jgi:signal peptidase I
MNSAFREILLIFPVVSMYYLIMEKVIIANQAEGASMEPTI